MKKNTQVLVISVVVIIALLAGCAIFNKIFGGGGFKFSHKKHVTDEGLECLGCHTQAEDGHKMAMPDLKKCMVCHEGIDPDKPKEKRIAQLFDGGKLKWKSVTAIPDDVKFLHKTHIDYKVQCESCHKGIKENTAISDKLRVVMGDCISCHKERNVKEGTNCATCHKTIQQGVPPQSHKELWRERHGQLVKLGDDTMNSKCFYCHQKSYCINCHKITPPKSHTNFWRQVGHSVVVGMDREACYACHQSDFCIRCHEVTPPRSHRGPWGYPKDTHCLTCHQPLNSGEQCSVCHRNTNSHLEAPAKPLWHVAGANCRQCHVGTNAPPHVDDGITNCESCHR